MILTYKVKHNRDFTQELGLAHKVAQFAIKNRDKLSTKHVAHLGLKSTISNGVLRKYGLNQKCKKIHKALLCVKPKDTRIIGTNFYIVPLKLWISIKYLPNYKKIRSIEIDDTYVYIPVELAEKKPYKPKGVLGIDRNTTKHAVVAADLNNHKVMMLGKSAGHVANKYKNIRKYLQRIGKLKAVKKIKNRQSSITKDLNHKISRKLVDYAYKNKLEIRMENLKGIRKRKTTKTFKYALNSWSFYQLQTFIDYKAKEHGVPVSYVAPYYTSKICSRCGLIGSRTGKVFKCPTGHVAHADINAAYNIGARSVSDYTEKRIGVSGASFTAKRQHLKLK